MTCYRLLLNSGEKPGFLDTATIDQHASAALVLSGYTRDQALELWREPWLSSGLTAANDPEADGSDI